MSFVRGVRIAGALVMIILLSQMLPEQLLFPAEQQPVLQVSPTSLSFQGQAGGPRPDPQYLTIANSGSGLMEWHASKDADWIILGGTEGKLSGGRAIQLLVWVKIEGLEAGEYHGTVTISSPNAQGSPVNVEVALTLSAPPRLEVTPTSLSFEAEEGGRDPEPQKLRIRNAGGGTLLWEASTDVDWLRLGANRGSLIAGQSTEVLVLVDIAGLTSGTHQARITITSPEAQDSPATVTVLLTITTPQLNPLGLSIGPSDQISTEIHTDKGVYEVGERVTISFKITTFQSEAYAYVFDISANGRVALLFPNSYSQDPEVEVNVPHKLPDNSSYSLWVTPPLGTEFVQIIATLEPLDLEIIGAGDFTATPFPQIADTPEEARRKLEAALQALMEEGKVATAAISLQVVASTVARVELHVDKGCGSTYKVGDPIKVLFMVTMDARVTLIDILANGHRQTLRSNFQTRGGEWHSLSGRVEPPVGKEILRLEAIINDSGKEVIEECEFFITQ